MHEYSFMQTIVTSILETLKQEQITAPVEEVVLRVGVLEVHSEAAARQAYELLVKGTPLEQARLNLSVFPPLLECPACSLAQAYDAGAHLHPQELAAGAVCPRCGAAARVSGGQGVGKLELVVADPEGPADV
ncbi:MAG: hydrogenase maturation nickel metallochaperone HypA [Deltaproteobacteria bacterium]|nr:hydrogenase maturation nickel metallochaperone HypA [Deltaproteobacteria bacterium]